MIQHKLAVLVDSDLSSNAALKAALAHVDKIRRESAESSAERHRPRVHLPSVQEEPCPDEADQAQLAFGQVAIKASDHLSPSSSSGFESESSAGSESSSKRPGINSSFSSSQSDVFSLYSGGGPVVAHRAPTITLLSVVSSWDFLSEEQNAAHLKLDELLSYCVASGYSRVKSALVLSGDVRSGIIAELTSRGIDTLFVGSTAYSRCESESDIIFTAFSALQKLVRGDVVSYVVKHAPCPVNVVKRG